MTRTTPTSERKNTLHKGLLPALLLSAAALMPAVSSAQGEHVHAKRLLTVAMEAYSNLDLDTAKDSLQQALAMAKRLSRTDLARIYVSYGVLWTGGYVDHVKGQRSFLIGLCLDRSVKVDPMIFTPDIKILYELAQKQVNPTTCKAALSRVPLPESLKPKKKKPKPRAPKKIKVYEPIQQSMGQIIKRRIVGKNPAYPKKARRARVETVVVVRIQISRDGDLIDYKFVKGDPLFRDPIEKTVREWRFKPYIVYGQAVETFTFLKFSFKLQQ